MEKSKANEYVLPNDSARPTAQETQERPPSRTITGIFTEAAVLRGYRTPSYTAGRCVP